MQGDVLVQLVPELHQDAAVQVPLVLRQAEDVHLQVVQLPGHRRVLEVQVKGADAMEYIGRIPSLRPALELPVGAQGEHGGHSLPLLVGQPGDIVDHPIAHDLTLKEKHLRAQIFLVE